MCCRSLCKLHSSLLSSAGWVYHDSFLFTIKITVALHFSHKFPVELSFTLKQRCFCFEVHKLLWHLHHWRTPDMEPFRNVSALNFPLIMSINIDFMVLTHQRENERWNLSHSFISSASPRPSHQHTTSQFSSVACKKRKATGTKGEHVTEVKAGHSSLKLCVSECRLHLLKAENRPIGFWNMIPLDFISLVIKFERFVGLCEWVSFTARCLQVHTTWSLLV